MEQFFNEVQKTVAVITVGVIVFGLALWKLIEIVVWFFGLLGR